ncbi:Heterocyst differentiation ATP-binding protein HepA [Methanoculleus chikugoensis]|uniref:Heterocyst differentiation ATP-binding protein HepA n=2 Tax=Methanoculleus chikugoensis TaxID=118126 RepID=A0A1M4MH81_9EURY|nr:Heterocyst differentiation ATP-binding protein HepA [Methanoculleus chikugoensis]
MTGTLNDLQRILQLLRFYSYGYKRYLFALFALSILQGLMETFQIILLYPIINATINFQGSEIAILEPFYTFVQNTVDLPAIVLFSLLFTLIVFVTFLVSLVYRYLSLYLTKKVITRTKRTIFDKLISNDYQYYVENKRGDILYNVVTAPGQVRYFLETSTTILSEGIIVVTILVTIFFVSAGAAALIIAGSLLFVLVVRVVGKKVAFRLGRLHMHSMQSENEVISGYVQGLRQIRSVCGDAYWREQYDIALDKFWDKYIRLSFFRHLPGEALQFLFFIGIAAMVITLYYIYQESFLFVIPFLGTFVFSAMKVIPRITTMSHRYMIVMETWPNLETIYQFLNDSQYHKIEDGARTFDTLTSDIVFDNVVFSYYKGQDLIEGINLTIRRKKVTALVGHSGSGKSTLVSLLLRYYDVTGGRIQINGYDLREYNRETLLQKVGYVSQDTFIYNTTVRENISFGGSYSDDEIAEAAKKANIHAFIAGLPEGYDSIVGDQGIKFSGGEKQRIAIARALVRSPEILVLDEATSNLDYESEAIVQESINRVSKNITTFIIAHRLSTIRRADTIYFMSEGKILESGNHDELMERKGCYYELYESEG